MKKAQSVKYKFGSIAIKIYEHLIFREQILYNKL